jgi:hypothetical protein
MIVSKLQHSLWVHLDVQTSTLNGYLWGKLLRYFFLLGGLFKYIFLTHAYDARRAEE